MDNLAKRSCNRLPTVTCLLCNAELETVGHLFISYIFTQKLWRFLSLNFNLSSPPQSVIHRWGSWRFNLPEDVRFEGDLLIRSLFWNIWLERNARMFGESFSAYTVVLVKCIHMFITLGKCNAIVKDGKIGRLSYFSQMYSMDFLSRQTVSSEDETI